MTTISNPVAALAAILCVASGLWVQPQSPENLVATPPAFDHVLPVDIAWPVASRTADPDVVSLYTGERVINIWSLIASFWPEIVGLLLLAVGLGSIRRLLRSRGIVGHPHCRKCWYALVDFDGAKCPECGVELTTKGRVIARSRTVPLSICIMLLTAVVGGYVFGRTRLPREGRFADWSGLHSAWLSRVADRHGQKWIVKHRVTDYAFVQINVRTGEIVGAIPVGVGALVHAAPRPDGAFVLTRLQESLQVFDLGSGEQLMSLKPLPDREKSLTGHMSSIWGLLPSADPGIAYTTTQFGIVQRWNLADRTVQVLNIPRQPLIKDLFALDATERLVLVRDDPQNGWLIQEYDPSTNRVPKVMVSPLQAAINGVMMTPDGRWLALTDEAAPIEVQIWDYQSGRRLFAMSAPMGPVYPVALSADGRWILGSVRSPDAPTRAPDKYYVFDTSIRRCVGELAWPYGNIRNHCILADHRTAVAFYADGQRRVHLLGWDLPRLTAH